MAEERLDSELAAVSQERPRARCNHRGAQAGAAEADTESAAVQEEIVS